MLRDEWEFEYTAAKLIVGATTQRDFHLGRVEWWKEQKEKIMAEVRDTGIEITESVAAQLSNYGTQKLEPTIRVRYDLQEKLSECHAKITENLKRAADYDGWVQVLTANAEKTVKLHQADWLYFFGKT